MDYDYLSQAFLPVRHDLRRWAGGIEDQRGTNSCAANAAVSGCELLLSRAGKFRDLSRLFVYWNARERKNETHVDGGSAIGHNLMSIAGQGVCDEPVWPFEDNLVQTKPSPVAYEAAARCAGTLDFQFIPTQVWMSAYSVAHMIKSAISEGFPVVFGLRATTSLGYLSGPLDQQNYISMARGGTYQGIDHAMLAVGYTDRYLIVENSYTDQAGDGGYVAIPFHACNEINSVYAIRAFDGADFRDRAAIIRQPKIVRGYVTDMLAQGRAQEVINDCARFDINDTQLEILMGWAPNTVREYQGRVTGLDWSLFPWAPA